MEENNYTVSKVLIIRAISSIVLVLLALYLNHTGGYCFFFAVALACLVLLIEYYKLFDNKILHLKFLVHITFGLISLFFVYFVINKHRMPLTKEVH